MRLAKNTDKAEESSYTSSLHIYLRAARRSRALQAGIVQPPGAAPLAGWGALHGSAAGHGTQASPRSFTPHPPRVPAPRAAGHASPGAPGRCTGGSTGWAGPGRGGAGRGRGSGRGAGSGAAPPLPLPRLDGTAGPGQERAAAGAFLVLLLRLLLLPRVPRPGSPRGSALPDRPAQRRGGRRTKAAAGPACGAMERRGR